MQPAALTAAKPANDQDDGISGVVNIFPLAATPNALLMSALLSNELQNQKINMSLSRVFEKLSKIQEITIEYPAPKRTQEPVRVTMLTEMDKEQKKLFEALNLSYYTV